MSSERRHLVSVLADAGKERGEADALPALSKQPHRPWTPLHGHLGPRRVENHRSLIMEPIDLFQLILLQGLPLVFGEAIIRELNPLTHYLCHNESTLGGA